MPSRWDIEHITDISAPIEQAWAHLIDISAWDWNLWTRLEAADTKSGTKGKLKAPLNGDKQEWVAFDFEFGPVSEEDHIIAWFGNVGPGGCLFHGYHSLELKKIGDGTTRLTHKEAFSGLLPLLGLGLPFKKLNENYLKMNLAFKEYVEAKADVK